MNYTENQQTGALAETDVKRLFISWGWGVGNDQIDAGYDLFVEPGRDKYKGARFLVQVKGTASKKGQKIVAQVSKNRLREYAENPCTVIIVRQTSDNKMYWTHAQAWANKNKKKLVGNGYSGVVFDSSKTLQNKSDFEGFLNQLALQATLNIAGAIRTRSLFFQSLDPRFLVTTDVVNGKEINHISPAGDPVPIAANMAFTGGAQAINNFYQSVDVGLAAEIEVEAEILDESPLFKTINPSGKMKGVFKYKPSVVKKGMVVFYPGKEHNPYSSSEISLESTLSYGNNGSGYTISNNSSNNLLEFSRVLRFQKEGSFNIRLRNELLTSRPIRHLDELEKILKWANQIIEKKCMQSEAIFDGEKQHVYETYSEEVLMPIQIFFHHAAAISKIHLISKFLRSDFILPPDYNLTSDDFSTIDFVFRLLKGESVSCNVNPIEIKCPDGRAIPENAEMYMTATLPFSVNNHPVGNIDLTLSMQGLGIERLDEPDKYLLRQQPESEILGAIREHPKNTLRQIARHITMVTPANSF